MYYFSRESKRILSHACLDLQFIANKAIKYIDFKILESERSREDQERFFVEGRSKARFGQSPHNWSDGTGSLAIDIVPWPIPPWNDKSKQARMVTEHRFNQVIQVFKMIADGAEIDITFGKDFKNIVDMPHIEMTSWVSMKKYLITE